MAPPARRWPPSWWSFVETRPRIPWAYWHGMPITVDDYMNARMIADPISILDCDIPVDGVAAFVFTSAERARDLPHPPVYVRGFGQGSPITLTSGTVWTLDEIMEGGRVACERLWESSGLGVADIDLPQLYDGFSPFIYLWLESLGYCPPGEAHNFVQDGAITDWQRAPDRLRWRRARQWPAARDTADAGMLPSAVWSGRRTAAARNRGGLGLPLVPAFRGGSDVHQPTVSGNLAGWRVLEVADGTSTPGAGRCRWSLLRR